MIFAYFYTCAEHGDFLGMGGETAECPKCHKQCPPTVIDTEDDSDAS